jgi:hypothetical protein
MARHSNVPLGPLLVASPQPNKRDKPKTNGIKRRTFIQHTSVRLMPIANTKVNPLFVVRLNASERLRNDKPQGWEFLPPGAICAVDVGAYRTGRRWHSPRYRPLPTTRPPRRTVSESKTTIRAMGLPESVVAGSEFCRCHCVLWTASKCRQHGNATHRMRARSSAATATMRETSRIESDRPTRWDDPWRGVFVCSTKPCSGAIVLLLRI